MDTEWLLRTRAKAEEGRKAAPKPLKGSKAAPKTKKVSTLEVATMYRTIHPNLVYVGKRLYDYTGKRYMAEDDEKSRHDLLRWLCEEKLPNNSNYLNNVAEIIKSHTRDERTMPFFQSDPIPLDLEESNLHLRDEIIPYRNGLLRPGYPGADAA